MRSRAARTAGGEPESRTQAPPRHQAAPETAKTAADQRWKYATAAAPGAGGAEHGRRGPNRRGLAAEELPTRAGRGFDLGQGRAATGGEDELRRLVVDDAAESSELEHFAGERLAVEVLGARSLQTQRAARTLGGCDPLTQLTQHGVKARAHATLSFRSAAALGGAGRPDAPASGRTPRSAPGSG